MLGLSLSPRRHRSCVVTSAHAASTPQKRVCVAPGSHKPSKLTCSPVQIGPHTSRAVSSATLTPKQQRHHLLLDPACAPRSSWSVEVQLTADSGTTVRVASILEPGNTFQLRRTLRARWSARAGAAGALKRRTRRDPRLLRSSTWRPGRRELDVRARPSVQASVWTCRSWSGG